MGLPAINDDAAPASSYEVGYGRPPVHTRFEPGRSGNPRGRPRGSKNKRAAPPPWAIENMLLEEAHREITITDNGKPRKMPAMQAVMRTTMINAMKGHARPQKLLMDHLRSIETRRQADRERSAALMAEYKVDAERQLAYHKLHKLPPPLLIPHPGDIDINLETGDIEIDGPKNRDQHDAWTEIAARRDLARKLIAKQEARLAAADTDEEREFVDQFIEALRQHEQEASAIIGEWPRRRSDEDGVNDHDDDEDDNEDGEDEPEPDLDVTDPTDGHEPDRDTSGSALDADLTPSPLEFHNSGSSASERTARPSPNGEGRSAHKFRVVGAVREHDPLRDPSDPGRIAGSTFFQVREKVQRRLVSRVQPRRSHAPRRSLGARPARDPGHWPQERRCRRQDRPVSTKRAVSD